MIVSRCRRRTLYWPFWAKYLIMLSPISGSFYILGLLSIHLCLTFVLMPGIPAHQWAKPLLCDFMSLNLFTARTKINSYAVLIFRPMLQKPWMIIMQKVSKNKGQRCSSQPLICHNLFTHPPFSRNFHQHKANYSVPHLSLISQFVGTQIIYKQYSVSLTSHYFSFPNSSS